MLILALSAYGKYRSFRLLIFSSVHTESDLNFLEYLTYKYTVCVASCKFAGCHLFPPAMELRPQSLFTVELPHALHEGAVLVVRSLSSV